MLNKLNNMSLTAKIAIFMIVVNLCGIAALAGYTWTTEIRTSVAAAVDKWTRDTEQFASLAAGGIKWGKAEVVQDSYALYRDDPSLNLVQFAAFNRDNEIVDSWTRDGADALLSAAEIAALAEQAAAEGEVTPQEELHVGQDDSGGQVADAGGLLCQVAF